MTQTRSKALWNYLEQNGLLQPGIDEEIIKAAKRRFRQNYLRTYKKSHRKREVVVTLSEQERQALKGAAVKHKLKLPAFVRQSAMAYLMQGYVVPDREQLYKMEQTIAECAREIQSIGKSRERRWLSSLQEWKYEALVAVVDKLGTTITQSLRFPPIDHDRKNKIQEG